MKNNRLRIVITLIIISYGGFLAYFCMAKPGESNDTVIEQKEDAIVENTPVSGEENPTGPKAGTVKTVGPVYLSEITAFYERVITILSIIIGIILVLSFAYVHLTSKIQAQDIACEALESESFKISLKERTREHFAENLKQSDIASIGEGFEDIGERVAFLEEQINIQGYDEINDEESGEVS